MSSVICQIRTASDNNQSSKSSVWFLVVVLLPMQCTMGLGSSGWANSSTGRTHLLLGGISEHFMKQEYTLDGMALRHRALSAQILNNT